MTTLSNSVKILVGRLRRGQQWLTDEYRSWVADDGTGASDAAFCDGLALWNHVERTMRCSGYTGCIWGANRCPEDAPVRCDGCIITPQESAIK